MITSDFGAASLRLAHVYGPAGQGRMNNWDALFRAYLKGSPIKPSARCFIHGEDVGRAVLKLISADHIRVAGGIFNAMDFVVDRADILAPLQKISVSPHPLPERFQGDVSTMNCDKLKRMEWRTGGMVKLGMTLERMVKSYAKAA